MTFPPTGNKGRKASVTSLLVPYMLKRQDTVSIVYIPNILSLAKVQEAGRSGGGGVEIGGSLGPVTSNFRWHNQNLSGLDKNINSLLKWILEL